MITKEKNEILSQLPFFDRLTEPQITELINGSQIASYKKGALIHDFSADCIGLMYVIKGSIRVYIISEEGREITLYHITDGEFCVLSASCVLKHITFDVNIEAGLDTQMMIVNSNTFAKISSENIYAECFTYKVAAERFSDVMWAFQQLLFMSIDKRLAVFLYDESVKTNSDDIYITHDQIAKSIGSAREVVSRMLKRFSEDGIVELKRGIVSLIDRKKLKRIAGI